MERGLATAISPPAGARHPATFPAGLYFPAPSYTPVPGGGREPANQRKRHVVNGAGFRRASRSPARENQVFPLAPAARPLAGAQLSAGIRILFSR
ncbi:unnamed protein product, partial [Iphiclides podalirius]